MFVKNELQNQQSRIIEKIDSAIDAQEFKKMKDMLNPLDKESHRIDKIQKTLNY